MQSLLESFEFAHLEDLHPVGIHPIENDTGNPSGIPVSHRDKNISWVGIISLGSRVGSQSESQSESISPGSQAGISVGNGLRKFQ